MKTFASKEDKKAFFKARQKKLNEAFAKKAEQDRYDAQVNPRQIDRNKLNHEFVIETFTLGGSFPAKWTLAECLDARGHVSQSFWREWRGDDAYGLMRGDLSFKNQAREQGISVTKLQSGNWTITLNGTPIIP